MTRGSNPHNLHNQHNPDTGTNNSGTGHSGVDNQERQTLHSTSQFSTVSSIFSQRFGQQQSQSTTQPPSTTLSTVPTVTQLSPPPEDQTTSTINQPVMSPTWSTQETLTRNNIRRLLLEEVKKNQHNLRPQIATVLQVLSHATPDSIREHLSGLVSQIKATGIRSDITYHLESMQQFLTDYCGEQPASVVASVKPAPSASTSEVREHMEDHLWRCKDLVGYGSISGQTHKEIHGLEYACKHDTGSEIKTQIKALTKSLKSEATAEFETQLAVTVVKQTVAEILALVTRRSSN